MAEVTAIILAAGLSRRMGRDNKLLLPINGVPMIRHVVDTYRAALDSPVIVVTGHEAQAGYAQGQQTSVACGMRVAGDGQDMLIGLGDQPLLRAGDIRALLRAHDQGAADRISIPMRAGQRGNPILVPHGLRARLLAAPASPGCKRFTRAHPEHVQFHPLEAAGFYSDIDTPEAYVALSTQRSEVPGCPVSRRSCRACAAAWR